jgi:hypothetical protein
MKILVLTSIMLVSLSSEANHHHKKDPEMQKKWDAMSFEDAKKYKTDKLAQKKSMIEEAQSCVNKTTDKKGIEACMDKMYGQIEQMKK